MRKALTAMSSTRRAALSRLEERERSLLLFLTLRRGHLVTDHRDVTRHCSRVAYGAHWLLSLHSDIIYIQL